jgi:truncated hemoglobin YjbI
MAYQADKDDALEAAMTEKLDARLDAVLANGGVAPELYEAILDLMIEAYQGGYDERAAQERLADQIRRAAEKSCRN